MKISFGNYENKQNVDKTKTTYSSHENDVSSSKMGYALDISGTVRDNTAYGVQGRTAEDIMQQAEYMDVTTQRNYMTVMSNSMSSEDFAKLQKEGYHPGNVTIEETVTITDHIKAQLAKAGVYVAGYTDDVSDKALQEVAGSQASAQHIASSLTAADAAVTEDTVEQVADALQKAGAFTELSEGTMKYMVENGMEPTIENIYRAQFSGNVNADKQGRGYYAEGTKGYYSMKAEGYNWNQLRPQMEKVIKDAGLDVTQETLDQAKWLIEKGTPLTADNLSTLNQLENLELPMDADKLLTAIAQTVAGGKGASQTNLADPENHIQKAIRYAQLAQHITESAVDCVMAEEKVLNLKNLGEAQRRIDSGETVMADFDISARRKMEEVRLQMTVEANLKLLESGYQIETTELSKLVEDLKAAEEAMLQNQFRAGSGEEANMRASLYDETCAKLAEIPYLPAAAIGKVATAQIDTLNLVHEAGVELRRAYEAAGDSYETMMTAPRADLGDSIKKAFRNVDDLLRYINMDLSEQNRRAVRILGYNNMEITAENVLAVKEADTSIRRVVERMTPAATLELIRDGVNPLDMTISQLQEYFDEKGESPEEEALKYSKYLYKLEQNKEITESERDAYIGIYRLFRQIEKTDSAAVGAVLQVGNELSFKNLLTAIRSEKKSGMDITVNDGFGGLEQLVSVGTSITDQIEKGFSGQTKSETGAKEQSYYEQLTKEVLEKLSPEQVKEAAPSGDMTLEQFAHALQNTEPDEVLESSYREEQLKQFRMAQNVDDETLKFLLNTGEKVTANLLLAADNWLHKPAETFRKMSHYTKNFDKLAKKLIDNFDSEEAAKEGYEAFAEGLADGLEEAQDATGMTSLDIREIHMLHKQIRLASAGARSEEYQIPVQIGEEIAAVRLRVIRGSGETGKVKVTMETESFGLTEAEFKLNGSRLEGYIAVSKENATERLQAIERTMRASLQQSDIEISAFHFVQSRQLKTASFMDEETTVKEGTTSAALYETAKAFIQAIAV